MVAKQRVKGPDVVNQMVTIHLTPNNEHVNLICLKSDEQTRLVHGQRTWDQIKVQLNVASNDNKVLVEICSCFSTFNVTFSYKLGGGNSLTLPMQFFTFSTFESIVFDGK